MSGGWNIEAEDWSRISRMERVSDQLRLLRGNYKEITVDARQVLITHQQGPVGSCRGHSGSTGLEWNYCLKTGEIPTVVLSPAWMYYETQRKDGIQGDRGATMVGGIEVMTEMGCCEDSFWPYSPRYDPSRPGDWAGAKANAAQYRINRAPILESYEDLRTWLGSGQGAAECGIMWSQSCADPVCERYQPGEGGHAIALPVLSDRKDRRGDPYVRMLNSHGERSGRNGWSEWSPEFIRQAMRHEHNVFIGLGDMTNIEPREVKFDYKSLSGIGKFRR